MSISKIEWTTVTWNFVTGCANAKSGCQLNGVAYHVACNKFQD